MACERRPGSRTKLASIESNATPPSSTPARRSTCQSYLMLWPALGTAGSCEQRHERAPAAESASGGRFLTGAGAASSPAGGRWPNGRYQTSVGLAASESPTSSASCGSSDDGLGVERHERRGAQPRDQGRQIVRIVEHGDLERRLARRARASRRRWPAAWPWRRRASASAAPAARRRAVGTASCAGGRGARPARLRAADSGAAAPPCPPSRLRQREELELGQDPDQRLAVGLLQDQVRDVELDRHVALDGDQLLGEPRVVGLGQQRLAGALGA